MPVNSLPHPYPKWSVLFVVTMGGFMAGVDLNVVAIALPSISKDLSAGYSLLSWVLVGYVLAVAALALQSGKLGDNYGKKKVYLLGLAIFGGSSAVCGVSESVYELIAFRIIQGAGASIMTALGILLIFESFPSKERGTAIGVATVAWSVGAVTGPVLGGFMASVDWRLIFYINVPVAGVAILVGRSRIPGVLDSKNIPRARLNLVNAAVLGTAIGLVLLWLTLFDARLAALGVLGVVAFAVLEAKSRNPVLDKKLVRNRGFALSVISFCVMVAAADGLVFLVSLYFQWVIGLSPFAAGIWVAPLSLVQGVTGPFAGRFYDRFRLPGVSAVVGSILVALSIFILGATLTISSLGLSTVALLAVIGFGGGLVWSPTLSAALHFVSPELRGVANATNSTLAYLGSAIGVALVVFISTAALPGTLADQIRSGSLTGQSAASVIAFDQGLVMALIALGIVALTATPLLLIVMKEQKRQSTSSASAENFEVGN
jgi:EmrB/QacA subfamily drug resistance transporter